eukprot:965027-Prymnesium_polylepis.1
MGVARDGGRVEWGRRLAFGARGQWRRRVGQWAAAAREAVGGGGVLKADLRVGCGARARRGLRLREGGRVANVSRKVAHDEALGVAPLCAPRGGEEGVARAAERGALEEGGLGRTLELGGLVQHDEQPLREKVDAALVVMVLEVPRPRHALAAVDLLLGLEDAG